MHLGTRIATVEDAAAIQALNRSALGYDHPLAETQAALEGALASDREAVWVATLDDVVVGYCHAELYRLLYVPLMVNVLGIAVDVGVRRRGVGLALVEAAEQWARDRNATAIRLVSGENRDGAHRFYSRAGFTSTKRQLNFRKSV